MFCYAANTIYKFGCIYTHKLFMFITISKMLIYEICFELEYNFSLLIF